MAVRDRFKQVDYDKAILKDKDLLPQYVYAPIDNCGVVGRWIRHKLLDGILVGTPVLLTIQKHRTNALTVFMKMLSFLGTEDFYTIFIMCLTWLFDTRLARLFSILMWFGFYTTGFLKTLLCLPRPPCPPVKPLEKAFDWALPSLHSLLGVILPWYVWLYGTLHYELPTSTMGVVCSCIVLWSFGVMLSRLYLGVHSPADIVSGGMVGVLVLSIWMQVHDAIDVYISQPSLEAQLRLLAFLLLLLCLHPITEPENTSFGDTFCVFGVISGVIIGRSQRTRLLGMPPLMKTLKNASLHTFIKFSVLRLILGGLLVQTIRISLKFVFMFIFERCYLVLGIPFFNSNCYRKTLPPYTKHYTAGFTIPPIHKFSDAADNHDHSSSDSEVEDDVALTSSKQAAIDRDAGATRKWYNWIQVSNAIHSLIVSTNSGPWDITIPIKYITYSLATYCAVEVVPRLFFYLKI